MGSFTGHKHVTLQLLWEEYKEVHPEGYQYSQFCEHYRRWARKLDIVLRQEHHGRRKDVVDHAGQTVPIVNTETGEIRPIIYIRFGVGREQLYLRRSNNEARSCFLDRLT